MFTFAPKLLRILLGFGAILVVIGLVISAASPRPLPAASCDAVGRVSPAAGPFRSSCGASCRAAWEAHCRARHERIALRHRAAADYAVLLAQHPPGSRGFGENRQAIDYLKSAAATTLSDPSERNEAWRWIGAIIFMGCCGGGAYLLLKQMQAAPLIEDELRGWKQPFFWMLVGSNVLNVAFALWADPRAHGLITWESYCFGAGLFPWWLERFIRLGASVYWAFAFSAFWVLGAQREITLDLKHADGSCGVGGYVRLLQVWSVAVPLLVVIPASVWTSYVGRQADSDMTFALQWLLVCTPVVWGLWRLIQRGRELRAAYRKAIAAVGDYPTQKKADVPPDPTTPFLGEHGWNPVTAGLVLLGVLWSVMEWSGVRRALTIFGL
jgi:hypothetical protein